MSYFKKTGIKLNKGFRMFQESFKKSYEREGFLVVNKLFSEKEILDVRGRIDEILVNPACVPQGVVVAREGDTLEDKTNLDSKKDAIRGLAFLVRFDPIFRAFAKHPKLLEVVRGLLGPRVKVFRDQILLKPPRGQPKPVHQDQSYFLVRPEEDLVTAWVALDEATIENGCMCYIPGSHRYGIFDVTPDPKRPVHHIPDTRGVKLRKKVSCSVPEGSVIFHHGCILHSSDVNRTENWRRAVILHYSTTDARSDKSNLNSQVSLEID